MLLELFREVDLDVTPLVALLVLAGLPVVFDIPGYATPLLVDITYEPLGVVVFATGIAFVYLDRFEAVQLVAERDVPTLALDSEGNIRDTNRTARPPFPCSKTPEPTIRGRPPGRRGTPPR